MQLITKDEILNNCGFFTNPVYLINKKSKNIKRKEFWVMARGITASGNIKLYEFGSNCPITREIAKYLDTWNLYKTAPKTNNNLVMINEEKVK